MKAYIAVLPGDGIGPEVVAEGVKALRAVAEKFNHTFEFSEALIGGIAIDETGQPLPDETLALCRASDAVLLGAVGGPKWNDPAAAVRPEQGLLAIRAGLDLFANLRPVKVYPALAGASTLKPEVIAGVDLIIVRELTGGLYFGRPQGQSGEAPRREAVDTLRYSEAEIARLMRVAFELARERKKSEIPASPPSPPNPPKLGGMGGQPGRGGKVTSVDKANVLASSRLWRTVAHEVAREYPDVQFEDVLVDACAMHLIRRPADFDVIATENMFGDILSDEAAMLAGSMGMLPSASLGETAPRPPTSGGAATPQAWGERGATTPQTWGERGATTPQAWGERGASRLGLYEPIHGSAPDIAGQGIANPLATILSCALLLRWSLGLAAEADAVEQAVEATLAAGYRCRDIMTAGGKLVGTQEMGDRVAEQIIAPSS